MHVALNLMYIGTGVAGGRVYAEGLLSGLAAIDSSTRFTVFVRQNIPLPELPDRFRIVQAPVAGESIVKRMCWEYVRLPRLLKRESFDVFHALGNLSPTPPAGVRFVLTIHDLIYRHFPASMPIGHRWFCRLVQPHVSQRTNRVIVPSHATFGDVVSKLGVHPDRIRIVDYGPGRQFDATVPSLDAAHLLSRLRIERPYVLSVARGYPHKNLEGLLQAMARLPEARLALVGEPYLEGTRLKRLLKELKIENRVAFTGFVSDTELRALYLSASVFAFPSLCEGFGLPLLEAMGAGVPIVASNTSAIPEAVGDAGILVDTRDPSAFSSALRQVLADPVLQERLRKRGLARFRRFSWAKAAQETLEVYRELM